MDWANAARQGEVQPPIQAFLKDKRNWRGTLSAIPTCVGDMEKKFVFGYTQAVPKKE